MKPDYRYIDRKIADVIDIRDLELLSIEDKKKILKTTIIEAIDDKKMLVSDYQLNDLVDKKYEDIFGFGPIEKLMRDKRVTEIMVNGPENIYIERSGILEKTDVSFRDSKRIKIFVDRVLGPLGLRLDISSPIADGRLKDGSRINAVIRPISSEDIIVTIRKFIKDILELDDLIAMDTLTGEVSGFLERCVRSKKNIIVSGGTSSGKTTFLNVLSSLIGKGERIVTAEETFELSLNNQNMVKLECRAPNIEGRGEINLRDLVRNSLRMRPDRIIIGEIRGPEAIDVLQAMNTGHEGSMTTIHANSPKDLISRLETMLLISGNNLTPLSAKKIIYSAIDIIIHLERLSCGRRIVSKISHIKDFLVSGDPSQDMKIVDIFVYDRVLKRIKPTTYYKIFLGQIKHMD